MNNAFWLIPQFFLFVYYSFVLKVDAISENGEHMRVRTYYYHCSFPLFFILPLSNMQINKVWWIKEKENYFRHFSQLIEGNYCWNICLTTLLWVSWIILLNILMHCNVKEFLPNIPSWKVSLKNTDIEHWMRVCAC